MPIAAINGTQIFYQIHGTGTPIVFIHPPLLTSANFRYQQVQLSGEFAVITFDIRGHGRSRASEPPLTYELIAHDLVRLLDYLGIRQAYVCGYSTGGSVAMEAMLTYPDRFLGGILVSAMSEASDITLRSRIRLAAGLSRTKPMFRLLMWAITRGNADSPLTGRNLLQDAVRGSMANIRQYYKYSLNYSCTDRLPALRAPILLLYGKKDRSFRKYRRKLTRALRSCDVVVFDDEKHQLPTKSALAMNETIRRWVRGSERRRLASQETGAKERPDARMPEMPRYAETPGAEEQAEY